MFAPSHGILPDHRIRHAVENGEIEIDPYNPDHLNPVSYDLTLGDEVVIYKTWVGFEETDLFRLSPDERRVLDVKDEPETAKFKIDPERGWILKPGIGYLMHTHERVFTKKYVPVLDGKSSIGRLFMVVHVTAGYGDPGFNGQYTLEVTVTHPLKVYAGMKIAQMRFHTIAATDGVEKPYEGNYTGDGAKGPVASRAYRQFKK